MNKNKTTNVVEAEDDGIIISLKSISKEFNGEQVLSEISLDIHDNEFVTLLGPSGCGKTTMLRIIAGFETPDSGDVYFDGARINDLPPYKRELNTVFQKYALFPHLNVYENVAFGLRLRKKEDKLSITGLGAKIWTKFDERLSVYLHPEDADPLDDAYQIDQSLKALSLSSWFGSGYNWRVPVMESDYVFTFLVLKMGTIYGILILILLTLMLLIGMQTALTCKNDMISFVGMSFILSLAFQSMISAASSTGSFMVVGLPFCFLGAGGTSAVTNYLMAVFVIYTTGHQKLPQPKAQTVPQQEQVRPAARKTRKERN